MKKERVIELLRGRLNYVYCTDSYGVAEEVWLRAPNRERNKIYDLCQEFNILMNNQPGPYPGENYWDSVLKFLKILEKDKHEHILHK